jgi:hypothetical protein
MRENSVHRSLRRLQKICGKERIVLARQSLDAMLGAHANLSFPPGNQISQSTSN